MQDELEVQTVLFVLRQLIEKEQALFFAYEK